VSPSPSRLFLLPYTQHSDSDKKVHNSWGGDDGETERKVEEAANVDAGVEITDAGALNDWAAPAAETSGDAWAAPAAEADAWGAASPADNTPAADGAEKPQSGGRREGRGEEEEDNTLTLDQYLAQQREKDNALVPKLEVRKPNEGVEDDLFKGAAPLKKGEEAEYFSGKASVVATRHFSHF
jgi:plasminogen activator inhibitor 1 RNA-binding protein